MRHVKYLPLVLAMSLGANAAAPADERCATPQAVTMNAGAQPAPAGSVARNEQELSAAPVLLIGRAYELTLPPQDSVSFVVEPEGKRAYSAGTTGGLLRFSVVSSGRYRLLLSSPHWADVLQARTIVPAASHAGHLGCEGLHKTVDYELAPGEYLLQLSGAAVATVRIAVSRVVQTAR